MLLTHYNMVWRQVSLNKHLNKSEREVFNVCCLATKDSGCTLDSALKSWLLFIVVRVLVTDVAVEIMNQQGPL